MNKYNIGDTVWLLENMKSGIVLEIEDFSVLVTVENKGLWVYKGDLFPSQEALAKHIFPELFESPWKKTSEELPPICTYVIGKYRLRWAMEYITEEMWFKETGEWYNCYDRKHDQVDYWMYIPE